MKIEELNMDVRTTNVIRRTGCTTVEELRQKMSDDMDGMKRQLGFATFDRVEEAILSIQREQEEPSQEPSVIVTAEYTRAVTLTRSIIANAQAAQQSLYEVCKCLKEMRDGKLYKELGYQKFEDYCENEVEIKWRQAYNFISIAEGFTPDSLQSIAKIGTTKLALLAKLDEPTREAVTESVDVENTTVKELKAQITALTNDKNKLESANADLGQKLDAAQESIASKDRQFRQSMESKDAQLKAVKETGEKNLSECRDHLNSRILELEKRIHEMEQAPIDHEMTDADSTEEIAKLKQELENEKLRVMQLQKTAGTKVQKAVDELRHKLTQVHEQELEALRDGYEKQLAEESKKPDRSALDRAKFYALKNVFEEIVDELETLLDDLHDDPRIRYINELDNYWTDNLLYLKREGEGAGA